MMTSHPDTEDLICRLFAHATGMLECAIEHTVEGQHPRAPTEERRSAAIRLQESIRKIAMLADGLTIITQLPDDHLTETDLEEKESE